MSSTDSTSSEASRHDVADQTAPATAVLDSADRQWEEAIRMEEADVCR